LDNVIAEVLSQLTILGVKLQVVAVLFGEIKHLTFA
jgi:hypothetical protein